MRLIKETERKRNKNKRLLRYGLFYCEYCGKQIEKQYHNGLKYKSWKEVITYG